MGMLLCLRAAWGFDSSDKGLVALFWGQATSQPSADGHVAVLASCSGLVLALQQSQLRYEVSSGVLGLDHGIYAPMLCLPGQGAGKHPWCHADAAAGAAGGRGV